ncbi:hypothetical protein KC887_09410, partial [Candidatus Kaiserbacteria bacterium]|nr:hypothetical protein [Candidatus Kaiserbacteria bacterium]
LSTNELLELLEQNDSRRANTIDQHNRRRLIRALEIIETLGTVPEPTEAEPDYDWLVIGIEIGKDALRQKFEKRITQWLATGFKAEVERLQAAGITDTRFKEFGFEYTLMLEHIRGHLIEAELIEKFVQKNWQYAKRQLTWLKRDEEIHWVKPENFSEIFRLTTEFLAE